MMSDNENEYKEKDDGVSASCIKSSQRSGFMKRFFDWIARGADRSGMHGASCPT